MQRVHQLSPRTLVLWLTLALSLFAIFLVDTRPADAAYPGRDGLITFVRKNQIYTITSQGTGLTKLTSNAKNYWPKWSPNGNRIAYVHETPAGIREIWVMNANGGTKQRVVKGTVSAPSWSPNGKFLYFGTPLKRIKSTKPFGSPVTLTGVDQWGDEYPTLQVEPGRTVAVSPTGNEIAYYSNSFPSSPDNYLLLYNVTTGLIEVIDMVGGSCCGEGFYSDPDWSPNGKILAYTDGRYCIECLEPPYTPPPIYIRYAAMHDPIVKSYPHVDYDRQPAFSPSNKRLVFVNNPDGTPRIYISNLDGSARRLLISNGYTPDWQPRK